MWQSVLGHFCIMQLTGTLYLDTMISMNLPQVDIEENELNLRRNIILGGVYYFDMLQIPPQPKRVGNWIICQLETPQVSSLLSLILT